MRPFLLSALVAGLLARTDVAAQFTTVRGPAPPVDAGDRIRVSVANVFPQPPFGSRVQRFRGTVRAIAPETLHVELPSTVGRVAIPRASIRRVELSMGPPSRRASALHSGTIGAVIFAVHMLILHQNPDSRRYDEAWQAAAVGAGMGFAAGAWFGAQRPYERWRGAGLRD